MRDLSSKLWAGLLFAAIACGGGDGGGNAEPAPAPTFPIDELCMRVAHAMCDASARCCEPDGNLYRPSQGDCETTMFDWCSEKAYLDYSKEGVFYWDLAEDREVPKDAGEPFAYDSEKAMHYVEALEAAVSACEPTMPIPWPSLYRPLTKQGEPCGVPEQCVDDLVCILDTNGIGRCGPRLSLGKACTFPNYDVCVSGAVCKAPSQGAAPECLKVAQPNAPMIMGDLEDGSSCREDTECRSPFCRSEGCRDGECTSRCATRTANDDYCEPGLSDFRHAR